MSKFDKRGAEIVKDGSIGRVLAQVDPIAAPLTDAYTVPVSTSAIINSIIVTNRSAIATSFRVSTAVAGSVDNNKQYIAFDFLIGANATLELGTEVTLAATDVIRVYATLATLSFSIFGVEIT